MRPSAKDGSKTTSEWIDDLKKENTKVNKKKLNKYVCTSSIISSRSSSKVKTIILK